MPLWIGSLIHEDVHRMLRKAGVPYMAEVNLTPWLPQGWGGTGDAFVWNPELGAFVLTDFKTTNVRAVKFLERDGAKIEHIKQTSAYWHAARKMGLPLAKKVGVWYIPKDHETEPLLLDFDPLPARELAKEMRTRYGAVSEYMKSLPKPNPRPLYTEEYVTDALAPVQEREQRVYFDRATDTYELKLVPHWSTKFCEFPDELCDCRTQGTTKIGMYDYDGTYYPRNGFEHIEPTVAPSF